MDITKFVKPKGGVTLGNVLCNLSCNFVATQVARKKPSAYPAMDISCLSFAAIIAKSDEFAAV